MSGDRIDVLVRAVDVGKTYLYWRWLDEPERSEYAVLESADIDAVLARLERSLVPQLPGESSADAAKRALVTGELADRDRERALTTVLTEAVLPPALRAQLLDRTRGGAPVRVRLTPSPRLARIPWELLFVAPEQRLLELAEVVCELPAVAHAGRALPPAEWELARERPVLFVVNPRVPGDEPQLELGTDQARRFQQRVAEFRSIGRYPAAEARQAVNSRVTRLVLRDVLRTPRSRLLYFGHVSADPAVPGSAALHLSDRVADWDGADTRPHGPAVHLPFSALDLFYGTQTADPSAWERYGSDRAQLGHELWPMPPRVAVIACEGGADFRAMETFGLVVAMANAGAGLISTTRWVLPSGGAFVSVGAPAGPTTDLALEVDAAHETPDPVAELTRWQRERLRRWTSDADLGPADTPLVWAGLTTTIVDRRTVRESHPADVRNRR